MNEKTKAELTDNLIKGLTNSTYNNSYFQNITQNNNNQILISSEDIIIPDTISNKDKEALKEKNKAYFIEFKKLKEKNNLLKFKLQELIQKKIKYKKCLNKLEQNKNDTSLENEEKKNKIFEKNKSIIDELINVNNNLYINRKRRRKKKNQLEFKYKCHYKDCDRKYATQGSLNQHVKLKHKK